MISILLALSVLFCVIDLYVTVLDLGVYVFYLYPVALAFDYLAEITHCKLHHVRPQPS